MIARGVSGLLEAPAVVMTLGKNAFALSQRRALPTAGAPDVDQPLRFLLKNSTVRCHASLAAASSYRGVVSLWKPCCVPSYM
jgi:hypothetical protein